MAQTNRLRPIAEGQFPSPEDLGIGGPEQREFLERQGLHPNQPVSQPSRVENAATSMLLTSLRALSQRALIAISSLFVLATAASAWWLWLVTMPAPTVLQLVGLALYGILVLALNWLVLRRR